MDQIFHALSHETRRKILDLLRDQPGQGVGVLARSFDVSRIAIMNHLAVLEKAGLVISEKDGRSRLLYLNLVPLQMIHERWSDEYGAYWAGRVTALKDLAERKTAEGGEKP
ncbi:transcriptional regulator, ArsR family [Parasphingorhabdus marina DSM 22363]|uniref:Transcriptional regulator, ArsR family n=1 Tax=Parasphingorhabdus marina DSM 22363 TaxID=1123272 RepID=A0A1N6D6I4_9SPHN|nr:helix-turn-helix transcriptional regulator [Parasphingorhabdus marina]SIN66274.1 transcriptional regulator, ArsR family [Parasphingorhabdus marina DSM 22363]